VQALSHASAPPISRCIHDAADWICGSCDRDWLDQRLRDLLCALRLPLFSPDRPLGALQPDVRACWVAVRQCRRPRGRSSRFGRNGDDAGRTDSGSAAIGAYPAANDARATANHADAAANDTRLSEQSVACPESSVADGPANSVGYSTEYGRDLTAAGTVI